ncbi:unnamed protein product, partial [Polarella glacialis]
VTHGLARSSSLPAIKKKKPEDLGASLAEPGCGVFQSRGAKVLYRKPNYLYGSFYGDPGKADELKIATNFPLPVSSQKFSQELGRLGHSATRHPGQPGFYRDCSVNNVTLCKTPGNVHVSNKDWTQYLL